MLATAALFFGIIGVTTINVSEQRVSYKYLRDIDEKVNGYWQLTECKNIFYDNPILQPYNVTLKFEVDATFDVHKLLWAVVSDDGSVSGEFEDYSTGGESDCRARTDESADAFLKEFGELCDNITAFESSSDEGIIVVFNYNQDSYCKLLKPTKESKYLKNINSAIDGIWQLTDCSWLGDDPSLGPYNVAIKYEHVKTDFADYPQLVWNVMIGGGFLEAKLEAHHNRPISLCKAHLENVKTGEDEFYTIYLGGWCRHLTSFEALSNQKMIAIFKNQRSLNCTFIRNIEEIEDTRITDRGTRET